MDDFVYKSYLLSGQEFMVLSACAGMGSSPVLSESFAGQISKKELELTVFQLYQKEIIFWKDEKSYEMKPELWELFQTMKASRKELQIYPKRGSGPLLCFWADYVVIMELSGNDKNTIKLHGSSRKMFFEELRDREILPARSSGEMESLDGPSPFDCGSAGVIEGGQFRRLLNENDELEAGMLIYDRYSKKNAGNVLLLDNGIGDDMVLIRDESVQTVRYSPRQLEAFLDL